MRWSGMLGQVLISNIVVDLNITEVDLIGAQSTTTLHGLSWTTINERIQRTLAKKQYEITNHVGNVLTVINNVKLPIDNNSDDVKDGYSAVIISATDYTPFGVSLEGRTWSRTTTHTFEMYRALEHGENINITANGNTTLLPYSSGYAIADYLLQIQTSLSSQHISSSIEGHSFVIKGIDPTNTTYKI